MRVSLCILVALFGLLGAQNYVSSRTLDDSPVADRYELPPALARKLDRFATDANVEEALDYSETVFEKSKRLEGTIAGSRVKVVRGGTTYAQIIDGHPTPDTQRQDVLARNVLRASTFFVNRFCAPAGIPSYECGLYLGGIIVPEGAPIGRECRNVVETKEYNDEYRRLLPAAYDDGIYAFRRSTAGGELPLAREISSKFHSRSVDARDATRSVALVQWSQFIEHDLAKTTVQTMHDGVDIECCSAEHGQLLPRYRHPSCKPLQVPEDDPYYRTYRTTCLNYVRSALSVGDGCRLGPANQLNQATDRLDLSQVYGNLVNDTQSLRTGKGGRLKSHLFDSVEYLTEATSGNLCAADSTLETICYESGDTRVNVNPYITLMHTLFLRSHNRLAKHLALLKPAWSDEQLFMVARRINTRIYQRIVREWLSVVTGERTRPTEDIPVERDDRVSNEFATAAIRFYNTMMPGEITSAVSSYDLEKLFYRPKDLRKREYFAHLVGSVLGQRAMSLDTAYVDDLAHLLFGSRNVGLDVLALDIQRGRDHGLARYTDYYTLCNGKPVAGWADLEQVLRPDDLATIRTTYATVHDVDLIVGAISERPRAGATVGPTLSCLIREQLDSSLQADSVPTALLNESRLEALLDGYSAARFMCDTAQLERVQRDVFRVPAVDNPQFQCAQLPPLDLAQLV
ncbi:AGAP009033-PA-like protein [Anopheles sinensis]|uniref:AGAP009033-PA-like protein n=1 Tax=Anopheles sinensis TaxID=74873 RepID=A0A084VT32_ANOSI|nr:AGAP009033-PA-like protein [Anopheles sinensis]